MKYPESPYSPQHSSLKEVMAKWKSKKGKKTTVWPPAWRPSYREKACHSFPQLQAYTLFSYRSAGKAPVNKRLFWCFPLFKKITEFYNFFFLASTSLALYKSDNFFLFQTAISKLLLYTALWSIGSLLQLLISAIRWDGNTGKTWRSGCGSVSLKSRLQKQVAYSLAVAIFKDTETMQN